METPEGLFTAADFLNDPRRFDGCDLRHPLEPDYHGGAWVGKFYWNAGTPRIHSFAHGGQVFTVARDKLPIQVSETAATVEAMEDALLCCTQAPVYRRGGECVEVARLKETTHQAGVVRPEGMAVIRPVSAPMLDVVLTRLVECGRWMPGSGGKPEWKRRDPDARILNAFLAKTASRLPALNAVVDVPTLTGDGRLLQAEGYDAESGLLLDFGGQQFPQIPLHPIREDAEAALAVLRQAWGTFPFAEPFHESVALAGLLTACIRRVLPSAPMFLVDAPVAGSGKGKLARGTCVVAYGRPAATVTFTGNEDEERKRVVSLLREGAHAVCFDNISRPVESDVLCSLLTEPTLWIDILVRIGRWRVRRTLVCGARGTMCW